tara:strand:- start:7556 stop:7870 length:315 start_codon:yes stop_codon:yes gene_type:complete
VLTAITGGAAATVGFTVALDVVPDVGADADADAETDVEVFDDDVDVADTAGLGAEPPPPPPPPQALSKERLPNTNNVVAFRANKLAVFLKISRPLLFIESPIYH